MFHNKKNKKKHLLAALAASLILTFSGGICAFAGENADADASCADSFIEETAENGGETDDANDSYNADSEETSNVMIAGSSRQKTQTDTSTSQTDAEDAAADEPEEDTEDASAEGDDDENDGMISLGIFRTTAYCPCYACSEGYGRHTCTGATARSGHTIAVDPRVIPFGSKVLINGVVYTAEDRGGAVRGNHIDIFFDNHAQTWQYGTRTAEVFLLA